MIVFCLRNRIIKSKYLDKKCSNSKYIIIILCIYLIFLLYERNFTVCVLKNVGQCLKQDTTLFFAVITRNNLKLMYFK